MIHEEAVKSEMLVILSYFMRWPELSSFCLVGGTSIALRFGYRESDDIDLFSPNEFDSPRLSEALNRDFPDCEITGISKGSVLAFFNGIKIDILQHIYPELGSVEEFDGIRFASLKDISAMKIHAVSGRGSKKDFSDLLFLHDSGITLADSVENYQAKYGVEGVFSALKSLTYFADAQDEPNPRYRNGWTWEAVMKRMDTLGKEVQKNFEASAREQRRGSEGHGY
jgi:hypothetical protein